jgi:hypothetical protein
VDGFGHPLPLTAAINILFRVSITCMTLIDFYELLKCASNDAISDAKGAK